MPEPVREAAAEIQSALDVAEWLRYAWSHEDREVFDPYPWEHLGDAEKDARRLVDGVFALVADRDRLAGALEWIEPKQQEVLAMIERNGFVFRTPLDKPDNERTDAEQWEKLAFTLYSHLCEIDSGVRAALSDGKEARDG